MRHDNRGCRQVLVEGGLGCLVVILSLLSLIFLGLREGGTPDTRDPIPVESQSDAEVLREVLEDALEKR